MHPAVEGARRDMVMSLRVATPTDVRYRGGTLPVPQADERVVGYYRTPSARAPHANTAKLTGAAKEPLRYQRVAAPGAGHKPAADLSGDDDAAGQWRDHQTCDPRVTPCVR